MFDNYIANLIVENQRVNLELWDTAGQEDFDRLRPLGYSETDVFLICYAVNLRSSFENIPRKWIPEMNLHEPGCPFLLVGTKVDLRDEKKAPKDIDFVTHEEGMDMAKSLNAYKLVECSALTQKRLSDVFEEACKCVFANKQRKTVQEPERYVPENNDPIPDKGFICCGCETL